ncbi:MAG: hypothetical protein K2V38_11610, partial [Gemmataceae bacterium]|nr:hypothetical protein [Gemmataceae bacterium]
RVDAYDLTIIMNYGYYGQLQQFPEAKALLRRTVTTEGVVGYAKGQALNMLVQQRGKEEAALLRAVLRNEARAADFPDLFKPGEKPDKVVSLGADSVVTTVWWARNPNNGQGDQHNVLLKDLALAYLVVQAGETLRGYGFDTQPGNPGFVPQPSNYGSYAFTSDEKRTAAFVKYGWHQLKQDIKAGPPRRQPGEFPFFLLPKP